MFEIADRLLARLDAGEAVAVATAVAITGSAPRAVGTSMALAADGTVIGSISGGCVEGAVYELCARVLATGRPELAGFGFSDEIAFSVGLSCGGEVEVVCVRLRQADAASAACIAQLRRAAAGRDARLTTVLAGDRLGRSTTDACAERTFTEVALAPAELLIFGAVEYAVALCNAASVVGYRVIVCDPRSAFATLERFPSAAEVVVEWPPDFLARAEVDERTVICVLSHDDRFDVDLIALALASPAGYVGAMGSRATHARRVEELGRRGIRDLSRLRAPLGLDLGASTPEETAVSILAEILASRTGSTSLPLTGLTGTIHPAVDVEVARSPRSTR